MQVEKVSEGNEGKESKGRRVVFSIFSTFFTFITFIVPHPIPTIAVTSSRLPAGGTKVTRSATRCSVGS